MKLSTHLLFGAALSAGCLALLSLIGATPVDLLAALLSFVCFAGVLYGIEILRVLRASVVNLPFTRAVRRGNRAVSSAPPARPSFLAARNAPRPRASLSTLNPNIIHS
jgi:hypothetical protein